MIKKEAEKMQKYMGRRIEIQLTWNLKNKCDTSNNRGNWNHFKIFQKIPGQRTGKARNRTTETSHV